MQSDQQNTSGTEKSDSSLTWLQDSPESESLRLLALKRKKRNKRILFLLLLAAGIAFSGWMFRQIRSGEKMAESPRQQERVTERLQLLEEMLVFAKIHETHPELIVRKLEEDFLPQFREAETAAEREKFQELLYVYQCAEEDYCSTLRDEKALQYYLTLQQEAASETAVDSSPAAAADAGIESAERMLPDEEALYSADLEKEHQAEILRQKQDVLNLRELEQKMRPEREQLTARVIGFCMEKNYADARNEILAFRQMMLPYAVDSGAEIRQFGKQQDQWANELLEAVRDVEQLELVLTSSGETLNGVPLVIQGIACTVKNLNNGELTAVSAAESEKVFQISINNLSAAELAMLVRRAAEKLKISGNVWYFPLFRGDFFHCGMYDTDKSKKQKAGEMITSYFEMQWFTGNLPVERRALYDKYGTLPEFQRFFKKLQERAEAEKKNPGK